MKCSFCPVPESEKCLAESGDPGWKYMCDFAAGSNPVQRRHVIERSALGIGPGILQRAASFAGAVIHHAVSGHPASDAVKESRWSVCRSCEYHVDGGCAVCKCPGWGLSLRISFAESSCPDQPPRWGPVEVTDPPAG